MGHHKWKISAVLVSVVLLVTLLVSACGSGDSSKKTLTFAIESEIQGTDIQQVTAESIVQAAIFAPPVTLGLKHDGVYPCLADSFKVSPDNLSFILTFPKDLKFSSGRAVTAADVKASIERYIEISPYSSDWSDLKEIKADGQTLTVTFKNPPAMFVANLASDYNGIIDVEEANKVGKEAFNRKASGVGPYICEEWVQGSQITFKKNPYYKDLSPFLTNHGPWHFDKLVVRIIPDSFTRVTELESGTVDVCNIPVELIDRVKANPNINVISSLTAGEYYLRMNTTKAPFNELKMRQAIAYAINRDEVKTILKGGVEPIYSLVARSQLAYSAEAEEQCKAKLAYNPDKAKALLAELGYKDTNGDGIVEKNGKPLTMTLKASQDYSTTKMGSTVLQNQLKAVGIDLKVETLSSQYVREAVNNRDFDLAISSWVWIDPDVWYYTLHSSQEPIWSSPLTDKLMEETRSIMDNTARAAKYGELSNAIADNVPFVPLFTDYTYTGVRKNVTGYQVAVDGYIFWNDAVKK